MKQNTTNPTELKQILNNLYCVYDMHMSNRITLKEIVFKHIVFEIEMTERKISFYSNN